MTRPKSSQPTDGELEILTVLWERGPRGLGELVAELRQARPLATTTVATMLRVMLDKGQVKRTRERRGEGKRVWLWSAKVGHAATASRMLSRLIDRVFDGSAEQLVAHLIDRGKLSTADLQQIRTLLDAGPSNSDPREN